MKKHDALLVRLTNWTKTAFEDSPIKTITVLSATSGAVMLLWYCLSLKQLPDVSLTDMLATFIGASLAVAIIFGVLGFCCVAPAASASYVLDCAIPEAPEFTHYRDASTGAIVSAKDYARKQRENILRGSLAVELTWMSILVWSLLSTDELATFFWPCEPQLINTARDFSIIALAVLALFGNKLPRKIRAGIGIAVAFSALFCAMLYGFHANGLACPQRLLGTDIPHWSSIAALIQSGPSLRLTEVLTVRVYLSAAIGAVLLTIIATVAVHKGVRSKERKAAFGPQLPKRTPSVFAIRFFISAVYLLTSALTAFTALVLARESGAYSPPATLALTLTYLAVFNIAYFATISVIKIPLKAYFAAIGVLVALVFIPVQNPLLLPNMLVNLLGKGYFRSSSVTLSGNLCPRLRLYGVQCSSKDTQAIVISNVNVLNRLGRTATLELQVRREGPAVDTEIARAALPLNADVSSMRARSEEKLLTSRVSADDFVLRRDGEAYIRGRQCDESRIRRLVSDDQSTAVTQFGTAKSIRLYCVVIDNVPQDQLLDYVRDGMPTYKGGYSEVLSTATSKMRQRK